MQCQTHPIPLVQDSARSSAFDRSLLLLRSVALHCGVWSRVFVGLWVFLILVHVDVDVEVESEVWFSRGRTPFLVLFAYLKRARLCMRIPGFWCNGMDFYVCLRCGMEFGVFV
jgi:hypothetical protein